MIKKYRFYYVIVILTITLMGNFWGRRTEAPSTPQVDYLAGLALPYRDWTVTEQNLTDHEKQLLKPDAVALRQYHSAAGDTAELAVLAGHRKQTVHTPAFCMAGGGWNALSEVNTTIIAGKDIIPATKAIMESNGNRLMMIYFFTDGNISLRSLSKFQFEQFKQRLYGKIQQGALVRVIVPINGDHKRSELLSEDFSKAVLPDLLRQIREQNNSH